MSIQSLVFAVGLVVKDALKKNRELWLVLQDMHKAYDFSRDINIYVVIELTLSWLQELVELRLVGLKSKTHLPCDFPVEAVHYPLLYGLKLFEQLQSECKSVAMVSFANASGILGHLFNYRFLDLQILGWTLMNPLQFPVKLCISSVNNFLAGMVKIFLGNKLSLANNLLNAFRSPGVFFVSFVLGNNLYFSSVCSLKCFGVAFGNRLLDKNGWVMEWKTFHHWKRLDPKGPVFLWFVTVTKFLLNMDSSLVVSVGANLLSETDVLNSLEFSNIRSGLHKIWSSLFDVVIIIGSSTTFRKHEFATNKQLQHLRKETKNLRNNKFKVAITPDTATLEYYQSIYTYCKQRFNIPDGIEVVKKSKLEATSTIIYETLATYFQELNFNIIEYCEEKYPVQSKYSFDFESETETSNKGKQKLKQYSRTTPNTPTLQKTSAKHLQTPKQGTSVKLPLSITLFPISLVQPQTPNLPLNCFSRPEDFQSPRNPTQQQKPISTNANIIDYLQENESNHSKSLKSEGTESEPEEITENEEEMATAYIAKIPEFTGEDNDTSPQEWLDKVQKAGDANGWIAARMLKTIPYFLQGTAEEWFENLEKPFENW
ncbi:hypothetical protein G9A89_012747 [Geosiphon pyriformis]|nr:hypothetical protein G9A89_012747 [Geosiphon pyriformis]